MRNIKRLFHDYQNLVVSVSILLGIAGIVMIVLYPFGRNVYQLYQDTKTLTGEVYDLKETAALLASFDEEELNQQLSSLVGALPLDKSLPTAFSTLEGVSAHTGISIEDISLGNTGLLATAAAKLASAEEKKLGVSMQPIIFAGIGTSSQVAAFLKEISSVKRIVRINNFDASFSDDDSVRIKLSLSSFYAPLSGGGKLSALPKLMKLSTKEQDTLTQVLNMPDSLTFVQGNIPADVAAQNFPMRADPFSL